ncbi:MAG: hypothetical protein AB7D57_05250 [Desulfovibrionaceae bacterium]
MAQYAPFLDHVSIEDQLKSLEDDELLDFWEETQYVARAMSLESEPEDGESSPEYERLIVQELQVRHSRRESGRP